jgi:putative ABC transport system ATP-binding protein
MAANKTRAAKARDASSQPVDPEHTQVGQPASPTRADKSRANARTAPGRPIGQSWTGAELDTPLVRLSRVTKTYSSSEQLQVQALRGIDLALAAGDYLSIVGRSGSGKSTLMHIIGCLDVATSGSYEIEGVDTGTMDERELARIRNSKIGFVFQQFNLLPTLTAQRNVEVPLLYAGVPASQRRERAKQALDRVGLSDRSTHRPGELSGGQQQRVAVARALVGDPALILADEPTGALDSVATAELLDLFDELNAAGRTVVVITHESDVAARANQQITLKDGLIQSSGATGRGAAPERPARDAANSAPGSRGAGTPGADRADGGGVR